MSVDTPSPSSNTNLVSTADSLSLNGTYTANISSITSNAPIVSAAPTVITLPGPNVPVPTIFVSGTVTADVPLNDPLQTPSCTTPYFAVVTDRAHMPLQYPQVGCSLWHQDCCLYSFRDSVLLKGCPPDFVTRSLGRYSACCPPEFDLLPTGIGRQTPCYSVLSIPYVPATTVTDLDRRLITDTVFALSYPLAPRHKIPVGPIVGGVVSGLFLVMLGMALLGWRIRARRQHTSPPPVEHRPQQAEAKAPQPPPKDGRRYHKHRGYYETDANAHDNGPDGHDTDGNDPDRTYQITWDLPLSRGPPPLRPPGYDASQSFAELPAVGDHPSEAVGSPLDGGVHPEDMVSPLSWEKSPP